jgi:hypothetical protein
VIKVSNDDVLSHTQLIEDSYEKGTGAPLEFEKFIAKSLTKLYGDKQSEYPKEIKIPKSLDRLLKGDSEPDRVIKLESPLLYDGKFPMWRADSTKGVFLRGFGYKNGDSRYPADVILDDTDIHLIIGGATGHGKSVTLNSVVYGIAMEYAPWEVNITLVDAKIVEFKRYASGQSLPHVSSIAATSDADYIISVLEDKKEEMMKVNSMFTVYGVSNIMDFRRQTGLAFARNVIIIDEFQTMFKNAAKKRDKIEALLDDFARLGRSTGYHLILASQEVGEIPPGTLANIKVRAALGCFPQVSEKLLGNEDGKSNMGMKGRIIINTSPAEKDKKDNVNYTVPYQSPEVFFAEKERLAKYGTELGFKYNMSFYDEDKLIEEKDMETYLKPKVSRNTRIYLGEPSFVLRDPEGDNLLKINMTGQDIENVLIFCSTGTAIERYVKVIKTNIKLMGSGVASNVFTADKIASTGMGLSDLTKNVFDFKDSEDTNFQRFVKNIYMRKLCLEADEEVFKYANLSEESDAIFYTIFEKGSTEDTEFNRYRAAEIQRMLGTEPFMQAFGHKEISSAEQLYEARLEVLKNGIQYFAVCNSAKERLVYEKLTPVYNWMISMDKVLGLGRDSKNSKVEKFKKVLQDCSQTNVRFIITTTTMDDLNGLKSGLRYCILDGLTHSQARKVDCEDWPDQVGKVLGVFYDRYSERKEVLKFKKMAFNDEILV